MRNLKRALSLTLASVMLLGMMVIGTSAAAGYSDVDADDNVEAIEVLQAVEVMVGDDRGFGPDRPVTRAEMAVVMGKLLNLDYNYYVSTCPFADVSGNYEWARGWVGACAANGIVSGRGEGIYDPGATVTAIEAASMMMRALGYFQNAEDYSDGFVLVTVRQGNQIGIFNGVGSDGSTPMTRNQVAQMALNALRSEIVDFTGTPGIEVNGVKVGYRAEYTSRTSTEKKYNAIEGRTSDVASDANHKGQYYVQLGEELYNGELRLNNSAIDDFGRPSRYWEYDGKAIGTYMKKELLDKEWTTEVKGKDLYDLLGADTIKNYDFDITIDGVNVAEKTGTTDNEKVLTDKAKSFFDETFMTKTYKSGVGKTGKGVLTQVFVNADTKEVDIAVINTYLAKAASDYNEKKDEAKLDVYGLDKTTSTADKDTVWYKEPVDCSDKDQESKAISVAGEDFLVVEDIKADDFFLVTVANGEIKSLVEPEIISAASLNEFSKDSYVVSESTKYEYNTTIEYDPDTLENYTGVSGTQHLKDTEYNLYLDAYGYLIGVEVVEAVNNYIFLTGIDQGTSNLKNKTSEAAGILLDGTFIEFSMNMSNSRKADNTVFTGHPLVNSWCTYTVDKDNVYTLKEVKATIDTDNGVKVAQTHDTDYMDKTIDHKHVSLLGGTGYSRVYGNDDTVYIVPELSAVASDTELTQNSVDVPKHTDTVTAGSSMDEKAPDKTNGIKVKDNVGIISGVSSVTVGIDNVDLRTWTLAEIQSQDDGKLGLNADGSSKVDHVLPGNVYTLYNKDGYVIAAVVLGEDNGTTKNLVYSHKGSIESERYEKADDEWTWTRKVIKDGVETLLTQKGDDADRANGIYGMSENTWYEVNFKADGSVKSVKHAYYTESGKNAGTTPASNPALTLNNGSNGKDFVNDIHNMENATENNSTVLYEEVWGDNETVSKAPSLKGSTLYVDTANKEGFYVNKNDIKSVLIQKNNSESSTTYYDTIGELEDILDDLNVDENGNYNFKISAILTEGRATVVIIHDWNETEGEKGEKPVVTGEYTSAEKATGATPIPEMAMNKAEITDDMKLKVPALYMGKNVRDQLEEILTSMGYKVTKTVYSSNTYTFSVEKDGKAMDVTCKIDDTSCITDKYYLLDNNDTKTFQKVNDTATVTKGAEDKGTGYAVTANGTTSYVVYGTTTYTMTAYDTKIENGYVKVSDSATDYTAKYETAFKVPAKGSNNGTGYTYAVGADTKFVAYGGTIPAADVKADIVLNKDKIKVSYTGFATEASNKTEYVAYNATITAPAGAAGDKGTGALITGITTPAYAAYSTGTATAAGSDVTVTAGYVKVTVVEANNPTDDYKVTTSSDSTGLSAAGSTYAVAETGTVTVANVATGTPTDDVFAAISDSSNIGEVKAKVPAATPKVVTVENKDVTVTITNA